MTLSGLLLAACALAPSDSAIAGRALDAWSRVSHEMLFLERAPMPLFILVDRTCAYTFREQPDGPFRFGASRVGVSAVEHTNFIALPGGARIPVEGLAFTSLYDGGKVYFVAALPDVWAADPKFRDDPEDWASFLLPVMLHELTHTRQLAAIAQAVTPHAKALQLSTVDDDVLQRRFEPETAFARMVREEIALLFGAARTPDDGRRRALVRDALTARRARHDRFFTGRDTSYTALETLFTDMEGVAQWSAYTYLRDVAAPRLTPDSALSRARNNRKWWSQEYGLALYLVLDSLSPGWQREVFPPRMTSAIELLERALRKQ